jgi:hypothetical protein
VRGERDPRPAGIGDKWREEPNGDVADGKGAGANQGDDDLRFGGLRTLDWANVTDGPRAPNDQRATENQEEKRECENVKGEIGASKGSILGRERAVVHFSIGSLWHAALDPAVVLHEHIEVIEVEEKGHAGDRRSEGKNGGKVSATKPKCTRADHERGNEYDGKKPWIEAGVTGIVVERVGNQCGEDSERADGDEPDEGGGNGGSEGSWGCGAGSHERFSLPTIREKRAILARMRDCEVREGSGG